MVAAKVTKDHFSDMERIKIALYGWKITRLTLGRGQRFASCRD